MARGDARRARVASVAAVTWRDGVHLTGTPIWCDARRRRDVCFVSAADRVGRAEHGQLIATEVTLKALGAGAGRTGNLSVPLRKRFTLGTVRLELIASGRGPGAAALHVDSAGRTVLYAGGVRVEAVPGADLATAEVRTCDAVCVLAPEGAAYEYPPLAGVVDATIAWTRAALGRGVRPILLVDTALDGLEVATALARAGIDVAAGTATRSIAALTSARVSLWSAHGLPGLGASTPLAAPNRVPRAVVALAGERATVVKRLAHATCVTAVVSWRAVLGPTDTDAAFAWPSTAGRRALLAWIESTTAREVFVTGAGAEAIAGAIGPRARVIGPPRQMVLFPREAS